MKNSTSSFVVMHSHTLMVFLWLFFSNLVFSQNPYENNIDYLLNHLHTLEAPQTIIFKEKSNTLKRIDDALSDAINKRNFKDELALLNLKAEFLLQTGAVFSAKMIYEKGINHPNIDEYLSSKVKLLCGLGAIASLEEQTPQATAYFSDAFKIAEAEKLSPAMLWILFHGGGAYVTPDYIHKEAQKLIRYYNRGVMFQKPQQAFEGSNWLIRATGIKQEYRFSAFTCKGIVYRDWGLYDKALECFFEAEKLSSSNEINQNEKFLAKLNTANIYVLQNQIEKAIGIGKEVLEKAKVKNNAFGIKFALKDLGIAYLNLKNFEQAEAFFLELIDFIKSSDKEDIFVLGVCYANLSTLYLHTKQYDKLEQSASKAIPLLKEGNFISLYAGTLIPKAEMLIKTKRLEEAKPVIDEALREIKTLENEYLLSDAYYTYVNYYIETKAYDMARVYFDSLHTATLDYYKKERLTISENLKTRYETEKKNTQLAFQRQMNDVLILENATQKRQKYILYFALGLSLITIGLFYNRTRLKNKLVEEQRHRSNDEKLFLKNSIDQKERQLSSITLQKVHYNAILNELKEHLITLRNKYNDASKEFNKALYLIDSQNHLDNNWDEFKLHFEEVHPSFFSKIREKHPTLSLNEEKHLSYIKIGLSTKEIARLMNINPESVQIARYRLKKKLALPKEQNIYNYINEF